MILRGVSFALKLDKTLNFLKYKKNSISASARNPIMGTDDIPEIYARIDNWRRHYRPIQRILAVPYYTPPPAGEVMQQDIAVKLTTYMKDALLLEKVWRNMDCGSSAKWFIKYHYIQKLGYDIIRRKLKSRGERIKNQTEFEIFNRRALAQFEKLIKQG